MKVVSGGELKSAYPGCFSGEVLKESLKASVTPTEPEVSIFHYHRGSVSLWHSHPGGQSFFVLSDSAVVGSSSGEVVELHRGEFVTTGPSERHWHGALDDADASLLTLTFGVTRWEDSFPERLA